MPLRVYTATDRKEQRVLMVVALKKMRQREVQNNAVRRARWLRVALMVGAMLVSPDRDQSNPWGNPLRALQPPWTIDTYTDNQMYAMTRFKVHEVCELVEAFRAHPSVPDYLVTDRREKFSLLEATVVLLYRMRAYDPWELLVDKLGGRSVPSYNRVFWRMIHLLYDHFSWCLKDLTRWAYHLRSWADLIRAHGAPEADVVGFVDGTARRWCKPLWMEDLMYNNYYKFHGLKYQGVGCVLGLIIDFWGPISIRNSDAFMYGESGLDGRLAALSAVLGWNVAVYGDSAYAYGRHCKRGYKGAMSAVKRMYNTAMNTHRQVAENMYGVIVRDWPYVDNWKVQKLGRGVPYGKVYWAAALLSNVRTLKYGNNVAVKYDLMHTMPSIHEYLHNQVLPAP